MAIRKANFDQKIADEICEEIATTSYGLTTLCRKNKHWPSHESVFLWRTQYPEFRDAYLEAKRNQVEVIIDQLLSICDDTGHDTIDTDTGKSICNTEWVNRSRLRVDTRKWLASKLCPKLYGDNSLTQETTESLISKVIDKL